MTYLFSVFTFAHSSQFQHFQRFYVCPFTFEHFFFRPEPGAHYKVYVVGNNVAYLYTFFLFSLLLHQLLRSDFFTSAIHSHRIQWSIMSTHLILLKFLWLFLSSFCTSHAQSIKLGGTLSPFTPPLHSPNGRFSLNFILWSNIFGKDILRFNYTYLGVSQAFPDDRFNLIWRSSQGIPIANDSDEVILENKDGEP